MDIDSARGSLSEPILPPDLERLIFEFAALSYPLGIATSMQVAWRVKDWLEPFLYRVISLTYDDSERQVAGFPLVPPDALLSAISRKPPAFFASSATHLFFPDAPHFLTNETVATILAACSGITSLRAGCNLLPHHDALASLGSLRRLTVNVRLLLGSYYHPQGFALSLFHNITHLELLETSISWESSDYVCEGLVLLPQLTHLAFNFPGLCRPLASFLSQHARLRAVVLLSQPGSSRVGREAGAVLAHDDRFVSIVRKGVDPEEDWFRGAAGGNDYWFHADAFIAAKRAGQIHGGIIPFAPIPN